MKKKGWTFFNAWQRSKKKGYRFENSTAEKKVDYLSKLLLKNEGAELLQLAKIQTRQDSQAKDFETRYFHNITEIPTDCTESESLIQIAIFPSQ